MKKLGLRWSPTFGLRPDPPLKVCSKPCFDPIHLFLRNDYGISHVSPSQSNYVNHSALALSESCLEHVSRVLSDEKSIFADTPFVFEFKLRPLNVLSDWTFVPIFPLRTTWCQVGKNECLILPRVYDKKVKMNYKIPNKKISVFSSYLFQHATDQNFY
jgi:hypothetical protein